MGFSITIQVDENSSMYLSNGYGDFSVGPLGRLACKYQDTGFYDGESFEVKIDNVDDLADALAETQDEAKKAATRDSVVSKPGFADTIEYYADEIYNADSTVDKSDIEIIKAEDVL